MSEPGFSRRVRLRIEQTAPVLGDVPANLETIARAASHAADDGVDLIVTPELSVTGYDLRDRVHDVAMPVDDADLLGLSGSLDVVAGLVERGSDFIPYNTAVHLRRGAILHAHRKIYLPTYGMFDEGRYFGRGSEARTYDAGGGWRVGLLVCEDLWHPGLAYLHAASGANLIIAHAAGGGRGAWQGGRAGRFASWDAWEHLACAAAIAYGVYVVVANRAGVEGSTVFCGGSMVIGPDGAVIARGRDDGPDRLTVDLDLDAVGAARRPFAHLRDEDPYLTHRELGRIIAEGAGAARAPRGISIPAAPDDTGRMVKDAPPAASPPPVGRRISTPPRTDAGIASGAPNAGEVAGSGATHRDAAGPARLARVTYVVGQVARQAMADRGARRVALIDPGTPEAELAARMLRATIGADAVTRIDAPPAELEPLLRSAGHGARAMEEALRFAARSVEQALVAHPINRTAMLLSGAAPPDGFLPLADLFASQVEALTGDWSVPQGIEQLVREAGGIDRLDAALGAFLDGRDPDALDALPPKCAAQVRSAIDRGSAAWRSGWIVPKLSYRTLGVDLFL